MKTDLHSAVCRARFRSEKSESEALRGEKFVNTKSSSQTESVTSKFVQEAHSAPCIGRGRARGRFQRLHRLLHCNAYFITALLQRSAGEKVVKFM